MPQKEDLTELPLGRSMERRIMDIVPDAFTLAHQTVLLTTFLLIPPYILIGWTSSQTVLPVI